MMEPEIGAKPEAERAAPWTDPAWLTEAHAWIRARAAELGRRVTGPIEQTHLRPWSTVMRVPTASGDLYFKANTPGLGHEAAAASFLAARRPDCIAGPIAADLRRGWMLMEDAGVRLRELIAEERDLGRWLDVLPLYAGVQIDLAPDAEGLIALGLPDMRLATLAGRFERLLDDLDATGATVPFAPADRRRLREAVPRVGTMAAELARYGIPETIQHDDLNDGQVYVRDGRYLLMDWGDACVSHPFFSMSVALEGVIAWGLDDVADSEDLAPYRAAYLRPFADASGPGAGATTAELEAAGLEAAGLEAALSIALRLGWVCRAVNGHLPDAVGQTLVRLRMFLDGHP